MGALGSMNDNRFRHGKMKDFVMFMFLSSTFFVTVVFMNMLICVMMNTYARVSEEAELSAIQERVGLIYDHLYLLDIEKVFKN